MSTLVIVALALMVGGLVLCVLSPKAGHPLLATVFWWVGLLLAVVGLLMILAPAIAWVNAQLKSMLGIQ